MNEEHDEQWLLSKGWTKLHGYKINTEMVDRDWEYFFVEKEDLNEFVTETDYYQDPNNDEWANDDLDFCIERQEEYDE